MVCRETCVHSLMDRKAAVQLPVDRQIDLSLIGAQNLQHMLTRALRREEALCAEVTGQPFGIELG